MKQRIVIVVFLLIGVLTTVHAQLSTLSQVESDLQGPWYLVKGDLGLGWVDGGQQLWVRMHGTYFTDPTGKKRTDFTKIEKAIKDGVPHEVLTFKEDDGTTVQWFISNAGRPHFLLVEVYNDEMYRGRYIYRTKGD